MMNYKSILSIVIIFNNYSSIAQTGSDIKDHFCDSILSAYLLKLYPNPDENILGSGRNYKYLSFRLPIENKSDTVKILNFGENSTHRPSLMLLLIVSGHINSKQVLLGFESIESDLAIIKDFFLLYPDIKKKYKLEILDIWLQSRKGIIKTDCYIH
jgi:hypothetical protein